MLVSLFVIMLMSSGETVYYKYNGDMSRLDCNREARVIKAEMEQDEEIVNTEITCMSNDDFVERFF